MSSCNTFIGQFYEDVTAKFNAYFLARERINKVERNLIKNQKDDFNRILNIFPEIDSNKAKTLNKDLKYVIEMASKPIQFHERSKYVDDCYLLIGRARFYQLDTLNAIKSFKYVNTESEDNYARNKALIWLMRTFIKIKEYNNAAAVAGHLNKRSLNKENKRDYNIVKAYYYKQFNAYDKVEKNLEQAVDKVENKLRQARYYYILGQINQVKNNQRRAYKYYSEVISNNPPYEMGFNARINRAQVSEFKGERKAKEIREYFQDLLKDEKNTDLKGKIYYEMALFELNRNNLDTAISHLKNSVRESDNNKSQKAYSYLKLGRLYYEKKEKYELAQAYYDSTLNNLDKDLPSYPEIKSRSKTLNEFVKQLHIVEKQDSLQRMARMDSAKLHAYLDKVIEKRKARIKRLKKQHKKKQQRQQANANTGSVSNFENQARLSTNQNSGSTWYFYNQQLVSSGRNKFQSRWGDRANKDFWRISSKTVSGNTTPGTTAGQKGVVNGQSGEKFQTDIVVDKQKILNDIPQSKEELKRSNEKLKKALYELGKIYKQNLNEPNKAIQTFQKQINQYPGNKYEPEVLYFLYLLTKKHQPEKTSEYKKRLFDKYPNSLYSNLVRNPSYLKESREINDEIKTAYEEAFTLYEEDQYRKSISKIEESLNKFPHNTLKDKFAYLKILCHNKLGDPRAYKNGLKKFIENYPTSNLKKDAQKRLSNLQTALASKKSKGQTLEDIYQRKSEEDYHNNIEMGHYFFLSFPSEKLSFQELLDKFKEFNKTYFPDKILSVKKSSLNDSISLIVVEDFKNKFNALSYYETVKQNDELLKEYDVKTTPFIITRLNYNILKDKKALEDYRSFFNKNY